MATANNLDDGLTMLSQEERILHSSYNDEDGSSISRSIASQRSARSGGYGAYDNRSIRPGNPNSKGSAYRGGGGLGGNNSGYGPSTGHDSFEDRTQPSSPDGGQGIGRRIGKAVRRLSGGHLSQDLGRLVDLFDAKHDGDDHSVDIEADDTAYDDNVYGAVINDQERLLEKRRSRRNACMVCLMAGMMAGFVLVVYGITVHNRQGGGSGVDSISSGLGGALGVSGGDSVVDTPTGDEADAKEAETDPPTMAPTNIYDEEEIQKDLGDEPIDASSKLPPPPANLSTVCAPSSVLTAEGRLACHTLCQPARCCFIEANGVIHRALGCRDSRSDDCQVYEDLCNILDEKYDAGEGSGDEVGGDEEDEAEKEQDKTSDEDTAEQDIVPGELASIPEMLPSLCSPSSLDDTYEACKDGCTKAECCYLASGHPLSCAREEYTCALYDQICSVLDYYDPKTGKGKDITIEIPSIPSDLSETCSPSSLETSDGLKACHKECFYSTCCDVGSCTVTNPELCERYINVCSNLSELNIADATTDKTLLVDEGETEDGTSVFIGEGSEEGGSDHPASGFSQNTFDRVSQVCAQQTLAEPGGISACNIACRSAMCCFYSEKDMTIVKGGHSDENHLGGSVTATCISNKSDEWCASYSPCQLLLHMRDEDLKDGAISSKELSEAVDQACVFPEEGEIDACEQICSPGRCCFDEKLPCSVGIDCSVYKSCQHSNVP